MNQKQAIDLIEKNGALLVYPVDNAKEPPSLWSCFFPRSQMKWEWDQGGDNRVSDLWHLKTALSGSGRVVYSKWYRGRATFFSKEVATAMLAAMGSSRDPNKDLSREARQIHEALTMDSPLSTKQLKLVTELRGRALESTYERALKALWQKLLIVGYGEFEDGAFPSLAVGATQNLFEDEWRASRDMSREEGLGILKGKIPVDPLFLKHLERVLKKPSVKTSEMKDHS